MRTLRIEDIMENPWNVVKYPLPEFPSRLLLLMAQVAATCSRQVAWEIIIEYDETHVEDEERSCPELDQILQDWSCSHRKIGEVLHLLSERFDVEHIDFNLSRKQQKHSALRRVERVIWRHRKD